MQTNTDEKTTVNSIHPSAVVSPHAHLGRDVHIGPFCLVEEGVTIGDGCRLASHVVIRRGTRLGADNVIHEGAVLGGRPQHLRAGKEVGELHIGDGNSIREFATIHLGLTPGEVTRIGDGNLIMVSVHIAHDCEVGNHTIIANNVMLAGHIHIGDRAYLSGAVAIHQFCRVGAYAMVGGQAHIKHDVPPYVTVDGKSSLVVGLNVIGLRRNGFGAEQIRELKEAYRVIYRGGHQWSELLGVLRARFASGPAAEFSAFLAGGTRGFLQERRTPRVAPLRLAGAMEDATAAADGPAAEPQPIRKAG